MEANPEKLKALDLAMTQIHRQFGKGAIMRLGDNQAKLEISATFSIL